MASTDADRWHSEMWEVSIPAVAHADLGASHALMALTALYMSAYNAQVGGGIYDFLATAQLHYHRALEQVRTGILSLDQINADGLLACCMLLIPCGLVLSTTNVDLMGEWLHHFRGYEVLGIAVQKPETTTSVPDQLISFPLPVPDLQPPVINNRSHGPLSFRLVGLLHAMRSTSSLAIDQLRATVVDSIRNSSQCTVQEYLAAIDEVQVVLENVLDPRSQYYLRAVFSWSTRISQSFAHALTARDELALAIGAHWLVCSLLPQDVWYVRDFGSVRLEAVRDILDTSKSPYRGLLAWPLAMLHIYGQYRSLGQL